MKAVIGYSQDLKGELIAPPSKNYTTRYMLVSCLAEGESLVEYPAESDDSRALMECMESLGARITITPVGLTIQGFGSNPRNPGVLNPHNAGAVLRFLLGVGALLPRVTFVTDYPHSLGKRPNQDLLEALGQLGVKTESSQGKLPITIYGGKLRGGEVKISGKVSSQYISSLLLLAPLVGEDVRIKVMEQPKSKPPIRTTLEVMRQAGIEIETSEELTEFLVRGGQSYQPRNYKVHGDYPGAAAVLSAVAVTGGEVKISRLYKDEQGEREIVPVLHSMGCKVEHKEDFVQLQSERILKPVEFNGDRATDAVLAMVGAACFASGKSRFYNVENLRYKECDRISEPLEELNKLGVNTTEKQDEIIVFGEDRDLDGGIETWSHSDHRVVMLLTILGLRCKKPIYITEAEHISKSYPDFFTHLQRLGAEVKIIE